MTKQNNESQLLQYMIDLSEITIMIIGLMAAVKTVFGEKAD